MWFEVGGLVQWFAVSYKREVDMCAYGYVSTLLGLWFEWCRHGKLCIASGCAQPNWWCGYLGDSFYKGKDDVY